MFAFRSVRRSRRPVVTPRVNSAPQLVTLEDRTTPANVVLTPQIPYSSALNFNAFFNEDQTLTGHFTNSKFADTVSADWITSNSIEVSINNKDATFDPNNNLLTPPTFNTSTLTVANGGRQTFVHSTIAVGDFVGPGTGGAVGGPDGLDDIAVITRGTTFTGLDARVNIYQSLGDGTFKSALSLQAATLGSLTGITSGDLNGDGKSDIVVTRSDNDSAGKPAEYTVFLNSGNGKFTTVQRSAASGSNNLISPQIADLDGDGHADLFAIDGATNNTSGKVVVLWNDGLNKGTFSTPVGNVNFPTSNLTTLAAGNFAGSTNPTTGNPILDIAASNSNFSTANSVTIKYQSTLNLRSFPSSNQQTLQSVSSSNSGATLTLTSADLNFDGFADLIVGDGAFVSSFTPQATRIFVYTGSSSGLPGSGIGYSTSGSVTSIATGDYSGNLLSDIAVSLPSSSGSNSRHQTVLNLSKIGGDVTLIDSNFSAFTGTANTAFSQAFTLEADVSKFINPATGNIDFVANGKVIGTVPLVYDSTKGYSVATLTVSNLDATSYQITANLSGSNYPDAISIPVTHIVSPLDTQGTLTASNNPLVFGQPITLTATLSPVQPFSGPPVTVVPSGTVVFFDNGNLIGSGTLDNTGTATVTLSNGLSLGTHPLTASYLATTNFNASDLPIATTTPQSLTVTVNQANSVSFLQSDGANKTFGDNIVLTTTVSIASPGIGSPTGSVQFFNGTTLLATTPVDPSTGKATFTVSGLPAGSYSFSSSYSGNTSVAASSSNTTNVTVATTTSITTLQSTGSTTFPLGGTVALSANVTTATNLPVSVGTVTFTGVGPDGKTIPNLAPVAVVNGVATLNVAGLALGATTFTATYSGSDSITSSSAPQAVIVITDRAAAQLSLTNDAGGSSVPLSKNVTFTATLPIGNGLTVPPSGIVTFTDNGAALATGTLVNGVTSFTARLSEGSHTIRAVYAGDATYKPGQFDTTLTVYKPAQGFLVASGLGGSDLVTLYNPDGSVNKTIYAFGPDNTSGVRVAYSDFNGDGVPDIAVGTGPGTQARVRILDGATGSPLFDTLPFGSFTGGVFVATGDVNGDQKPDLVVTPDVGGGPRVRVFNGNGFTQLADFFGISDPNFRGGARAGVGDVNKDGFGEVIVSAGVGGGPRVSTWDGRSFTGKANPTNLYGDFFVFEDTLRNGVYVAAGDINGDGFADPIFGAGPGGAPRVVAMSGRNLTTSVGSNTSFIANLFSGDPNGRGGVPVASVVRTNGGRADIVTGAAVGGNTVSVYSGASFDSTLTPEAALSFDVFTDGSNPVGGVFVG